MLRVIDKQQITTNMLRISLGGEQLSDFAWKPGCYVKLRIPRDAGKKMRTYTARSYHADRQTIDIDFAIHHPAGPATRWALDAEIGDEIELKGPGHLRMDATDGNWHLFSVDMSALPAAISILETLNPDAKGYAFFEITDPKDQQEISIPEGIEVQWLIHPNPYERSTQQLDAIKAITPFYGIPNVFVAGELGTIREIRHYLREEPVYRDAATYVSSYWKIGSNEEEHKQAKRMMRG